MYRRPSHAVLWPPLLLLSALACTPTVQDHRPRVSDTVRERLGHRVHWGSPTPDADPEVQARIAALLEGEVGIEDALQVALLSNPDLQVLYQDLGLARADLLQACTLRNPILSMFGRAPLGRGVM